MIFEASDPRYLRASFFEHINWGRPGFDSGFVMRVSMPGDGDRPAKSIPKP